MEQLEQKDFDPRVLGEMKYRSPVDVGTFVDSDDRFAFDISYNKLSADIERGDQILTLERSGPRSQIYFNPSDTRAGIVTCGGICPGINNIIRSVTLELLLQYKIAGVFGYRYGFKGLADQSYPSIPLTPERVSGIHQKGGTVLGSSRGPQDVGKMVDRLQKDNIQILFVIGGDGSLKGAMAIEEEVGRRGLGLAVVAVPKTIDNDLNFMSKSFGFETAYSKAVEAIDCVHTECLSYENSIGIVKVMGRHSGAIAAHASISSHDVNFCLIPEVPFTLEGEGGLLQAIELRLRERSHAVVVVAEGCAQDLIPHEEGHDDSGNLKLADVGLWLKREVGGYLKQKGVSHTIKYIDPSYIIRSIPASPDDALYCTFLAQYAVHAAMAGRTGVVIGQWNHFFANLPIHVVVRERKLVNINGSIWRSVLESTGQKVGIFPS